MLTKQINGKFTRLEFNASFTVQHATHICHLNSAKLVLSTVS